MTNLARDVIAINIAAAAMFVASCRASGEPEARPRDEAFEQVCDKKAFVEVLDPVDWRRYKQLVARNSARNGSSPALVEVDGYAMRFGKGRAYLRSTFPLGTHDDEIVILHDDHDVAVLHDAVKVAKGFGADISRSCLDHGGVARYFR